MLDAIPDGEPVRWLYAPMREYPSRPGQGVASCAVPVAGRAFGGDTSTTCWGAGGDRDDAQRLSGPRRRGRRQRDAPGETNVVGDARHRGRTERRRRHRGDRGPGAASGDPSISIATWPIWSGPSSTRWRCAHSEGQATEVGWQLDNVGGSGAVQLPRAHHAQDVLVHHDSSASRRRDRRIGRHRRRWGRWCGSVFTSAPPSRSATTC